MILIKNIIGTPANRKTLQATRKALEGVLLSEIFYEEFMKLDFNVVLNDKDIEMPLINLYTFTQGDLKIKTVKFYKDNNGTPGGASERLQQIRLNTAYFTKDNIPVNAKTLIHEYLHLIGFDHNGSQDWQSVPYQVGDLVLKILRKYPYIDNKVELKRVSRGFPLCFLKTWKWV
jgi:predicted SprT family Zn-dependent metalloprotease